MTQAVTHLMASYNLVPRNDTSVLSLQ